MDHTAPQGLIEHFSKLEDPRVDRNKKHELIDVVVLCVCAVLSGAEGWCDIEEFGRTKLDWLRRYAPHNIGVIRHMAMNLLKREKTKISYRKKRIRAALNDTFRHKLLMGQ